MADVDLIPADYARAQLVLRRVRQLLIACVAIFVVAGALRLGLSLAMSSEKLNIARLEKELQMSARSKAEADNYRQQKLLAENQLAELDELRGRDRLRLLLQAIDAAYSDGVWLEELRFFRRDPVPNASPPPGGAIAAVKQKAPASAAQRVEIIGHATNHTRLAEFMRSLGSQPGIAEVRLQDTGLRSDSAVIDLTLLLFVDDKVNKPL